VVKGGTIQNVNLLKYGTWHCHICKFFKLGRGLIALPNKRLIFVGQYGNTVVLIGLILLIGSDFLIECTGL